MNSLFTSFVGHEKYEKNCNYSYARIKHIEIISLLLLTCYILVDDPISFCTNIGVSEEASYYLYSLSSKKVLSLTFFSHR